MNHKPGTRNVPGVMQKKNCTESLMHPVVSPTAGQLYGLEKFWAFLKYSKIKNQPIDPKLQEHLSQFKNLEDFRVVVSVALHVCTCA